jgi:hypothetical protein
VLLLGPLASRLFILDRRPFLLDISHLGEISHLGDVERTPPNCQELLA